MIVDPPGPSLGRAISLSFMGDWGAANLTRVCGWLVQELVDRASPGSRCAIWTGRGGADALFAVGRGEVDVALCTPAVFATMAVDGVGPFAGQPQRDLRALAVIPQDDRLIVALDASLGIRSFADLRQAAPALRLAASPDDGVNLVGLATHELMAAAGIDDDTFASWGGVWVEDERPPPCVERYAAGVVDGVIYEAIMGPWWEHALRARDTVLLPVEQPVLDDLSERFGWRQGVVESGRLPGLEAPLQTLDFADFLVLVRADLPEDVAYVLAWCLTETKEVLERQYRHFPPDRSPISYPLDPESMARTPVPLHDGAARWYQERAGR